MKKMKRFSAALLALGLGTATLFTQLPVRATEKTADTAADTAVQTADPSIVTTNGIQGWPQASDISSTAAIVMETSTNTVLYSKNADQALYPASAVKVMTCLMALENSSLDDQVTMTATGVSGVTDGGANISAQLDEVFTMEQCLYAIMVASANDIALQVAEHISGSVEDFVAAMNTRAQELGCTNTVFTNPTGLPDENQHTTAHDMALIFQQAIKNQDFLDIIGTQSFTIEPTNMNPESRVLNTHHALLSAAAPEHYDGCFGGKTGVTEASKNTLVSGATRDGMTLIAVAMRADAGQVCQDHISMFDYGFNNFRKVEVPGGAVTIPKDVQVSDLTTTESADGEAVRETYYFGQDYFVGTGTKTEEVAQDTEEPETLTPEVTVEPQNDPENETDTTGPANLSQIYKIVIYILAGLIGLTVLVTIISAVRKRHRRKRRRKGRK